MYFIWHSRQDQHSIVNMNVLSPYLGSIIIIASFVHGGLVLLMRQYKMRTSGRGKDWEQQKLLLLLRPIDRRPRPSIRSLVVRPLAFNHARFAPGGKYRLRSICLLAPCGGPPLLMSLVRGLPCSHLSRTERRRDGVTFGCSLHHTDRR